MLPIGVAQTIEVDRLMVEEYGILLTQVMENAGRSLAAVARQLLGGSAAGRKVIVLVGKGNNGGGGLVAARHLANAGASVMVALAPEPGELREVPGQQLCSLHRMGVAGSNHPASAERLPPQLTVTDLLLDALIGYSMRGAPREPVAGLIRAANAAPVLLLALDIPSGLDGDSGAAHEPCARAIATLTLAWPKAGLLAEQAKPYVEELYLADISVPHAVYREVGVDRGHIFSRGPLLRVEAQGDKWRVDSASRLPSC